jgi:hypothetical protein
VELIGLALAFPAVLVANVVYVPFVRFGLVRWQSLWPTVLWVSRAILLLLVMDVGLVATLGAVGARTLIGPAYWIGHVLVVLAGAPALAHVLLLPPGRVWSKRWYAVIPICFLLGIALVFFQVGVGGALYGPDGIGGPFSDEPLPDGLSVPGRERAP